MDELAKTYKGITISITCAIGEKMNSKLNNIDLVNALADNVLNNKHQVDALVIRPTEATSDFEEINNKLQQMICESTMLKTALIAAVKWMDYYGEPLRDEKSWETMITDPSVNNEYKLEMTQIKTALLKAV